jgi:RuvB-like protein 2
LEPEALQSLATIGLQTSLRYCLNLIAPASLVATRRKSTKVSVADLRMVYKYFTDVGRSAAYMKEVEGLLMFDEVRPREPQGVPVVNGSGSADIAMDMS